MVKSAEIVRWYRHALQSVRCLKTIPPHVRRKLLHNINLMFRVPLTSTAVSRNREVIERDLQTFRVVCSLPQDYINLLLRKTDVVKES